MRDYAILIFEPSIPENYNPGVVLWKGQIDADKYYRSVNLAILQDNIEWNNRRTLEAWHKFLYENNISFETLFKSEFAQSLKILDVDNKTFEFQLFCCDIRASNNKIEISNDFIMAALFILDLKRQGVLNPNTLLNKVKNARIIIEADRDRNLDTYDSMINIFKSLEKLCDNCMYYENEIRFYVEKY